MLKKSIRLRLLFALTVVGALFSCEPAGDQTGLEPVVEVKGKVLTQNELREAIPQGVTGADSIAFAQGFISRWVKKNLLLNKAELNLTDEEKDITQLLEDYRASLLIHKYQQKLIQQKYAPMIKSKEIEAYYTEMSNNFILHQTILKGMFIKVPQKAPKIEQIKKWYSSDKPEDEKSLEAYCYQNANKFQDFSENWIEASQLSPLMPESMPDNSKFYKNRSFFETQDSSYVYFVFIKDYKLKEELSPLEYVDDKIKAILLNKKRIEFIQNLEEELYEEGLKKKSITYYQ